MKTAVKVRFWRGTDPQKFCQLLIWPCTKFHAFIIKCTIFSHIRPTTSHHRIQVLRVLGAREIYSGVTIKAKSRWGGNKSITKIVIYQNVRLGLKFTRQPA